MSARDTNSWGAGIAKVERDDVIPGKIAVRDTGITSIPPAFDVPLRPVRPPDGEVLRRCGLHERSDWSVCCEEPRQCSAQPVRTAPREAHPRSRASSTLRDRIAGQSSNHAHRRGRGRGRVAAEAMRLDQVERSRTVRVGTSATFSDKAFDGANVEVRLRAGTDEGRRERLARSPGADRASIGTPCLGTARSADRVEGLAVYREKRTPRFVGSRSPWRKR